MKWTPFECEIIIMKKKMFEVVSHTLTHSHITHDHSFFLLLLIHLTNAIPFYFFLNPNKFSEIGLTSDHNLPSLWCCMRVSRLAWRWRWQTISGNLNIAIKVAENCFYFVFNKCVEHDIFTQKKWEKTKNEKETRWSIKLPSRVFVYRGFMLRTLLCIVVLLALVLTWILS